MKVRDVKIDDEYIVVDHTDSILSVSKAIAEAGIPDAIVIDDEKRALGALDDYDIISKVIAPEKDVTATTAEDIMYAPPPVYLDTELEQVHTIMNELEATVLPVVDENKKLEGVITIMDVLEAKTHEDRSVFSRLLGR